MSSCCPPAPATSARDSGSGLLVIGGYPAGQENYDLRRADLAALDAMRRNIAGVDLPEADPVHGAGGPVTVAWA
jgi:uncharacterized protein YjlB